MEKEKDSLQIAYSQGYNSYPRMIVANNPYPEHNPLHDEWAIGRSEAKRDVYDEQMERED